MCTRPSSCLLYLSLWPGLFVAEYGKPSRRVHKFKGGWIEVGGEGVRAVLRQHSQCCGRRWPTAKCGLRRVRCALVGRRVLTLLWLLLQANKDEGPALFWFGALYEDRNQVITWDASRDIWCLDLVPLFPTALIAQQDDDQAAAARSRPTHHDPSRAQHLRLDGGELVAPCLTSTQ